MAAVSAEGSTVCVLIRRLLLAEPIDRKCALIDLGPAAERTAALGPNYADRGRARCREIIGCCLGGVRHGALHTRLLR